MLSSILLYYDVDMNDPNWKRHLLETFLNKKKGYSMIIMIHRSIDRHIQIMTIEDGHS